jgi:hydroxymethyl cephem carbamoyltransferase
MLGVNLGHDGAVCEIRDQRLSFYAEAEKDSSERFSPFRLDLLTDHLTRSGEMPSALAIGGWTRDPEGVRRPVGAGYFGLARPDAVRLTSAAGPGMTVYHVSHERGHIFEALATSDVPMDADCTVLVYEGLIGAFYRISKGGSAIDRIPVLSQPGARYAAIYGIADPRCPGRARRPPRESAGKLMALAGLADDQAPHPDTARMVEAVLSAKSLFPFVKEQFQWSPIYDAGFREPEVHRAARLVTDRLFATFEKAAGEADLGGQPLLVGGGCGLNCEWNARWEASGLFTSVSVSPFASDAGAALGAAAAAQWEFLGTAKVAWNPYSGLPFQHDLSNEEIRALGWSEQTADDAAIAGALAAGEVVAWVEGRFEAGPRALGHRSLIAAAWRSEMRDILNVIKQREWYRPVAPVCQDRDFDRYFTGSADKYMLRFAHVRNPSILPSVTHADGTARVQLLDGAYHKRLIAVLECLRSMQLPTVLCNTSLNKSGHGFFNHMSDLLAFCADRGISHAVVDGDLYRRKP